MSPTQFWRRRFGLIVGPYPVWTRVYAITDRLIVDDDPFPAPGGFLTDLAHDAATGTGKYQLYFLLISMQIYLMFPALAWVLRRYAGHPWRMLTAGFVVQVAMFVLYQYVPRPSGHGWSLLFGHLWKILVPTSSRPLPGPFRCSRIHRGIR